MLDAIRSLVVLCYRLSRLPARDDVVNLTMKLSISRYSHCSGQGRRSDEIQRNTAQGFADAFCLSETEFGQGTIDAGSLNASRSVVVGLSVTYEVDSYERSARSGLWFGQLKRCHKTSLLFAHATRQANTGQDDCCHRRHASSTSTFFQIAKERDRNYARRNESFFRDTLHGGELLPSTKRSCCARW